MTILCDSCAHYIEEYNTWSGQTTHHCRVHEKYEPQCPFFEQRKVKEEKVR